MSLIKKQINSSLRGKIDEWFDETFGEYIPKCYAIDDEFNIVLNEYYALVGHEMRCDSAVFDWLCIFYRLSQRHCTQPGTTVSIGKNKRTVITNFNGEIRFIPEFIRFKFFSKELDRYVHDKIEAQQLCEIINYYSPYISNLDKINLKGIDDFGFGHIYRNSENKWILKIWLDEIVI